MSKRMRRRMLSALSCAALLGGCSKAVEKDVAANEMAQPPTVEAVEEPDSVRGAEGDTTGAPTDQWVGRWTGPEGLFLDIQPSPDGKPGHYAITNRDTLDRERDYAGVADGATIRFTRDGKTLVVRAGTGAESGFKYLAGKQDCLVVVAGQEGYCR